jgi:hypothetical protein
MNPGKHGVLTFRALDYSRYSSFVERFATSETFAHLSIFRTLSDAGLRVASVGVPMTFPPFAINGALISGTPKVAIDPSSTYPSSLPDEVGRFTEQPPRLGRKDDFRGYMARYLDAFSGAAQHLLERERWDLFCVVYSNTDWVVHQFWEYYDESFPTYTRAGAERSGGGRSSGVDPSHQFRSRRSGDIGRACGPVPLCALCPLYRHRRGGVIAFQPPPVVRGSWVWIFARFCCLFPAPRWTDRRIGVM